jgi:hypothetical protein
MSDDGKVIVAPDPLKVACIYCSAPIGQRCGALPTMTRFHKVRVTDAVRLATEGLVRGSTGWRRASES